MNRFTWLLLLSPMALVAQPVPDRAIPGWCQSGATKASVSGMSSSNTLQGVIPACTVTVYLTGTTTKAVIHSDSNNTPLSNPFTAADSGQWTIFTQPATAYDIVLSGGKPGNTYAHPVTLTAIQVGGPGAGGATSPGGANQEIQFNANGFFEGTTGLTWSSTNNALLYPTGAISANTINASNALAAGTITANSITSNGSINGATVTATGAVSGATLNSTGNATVGGNLTVSGSMGVVNATTITATTINGPITPTQVTWPANCSAAGMVYNFALNSCINMNAIDPASQIVWPASCNSTGMVYDYVAHQCVKNINAIDPGAQITWASNCNAPNMVYNLSLNSCITTQIAITAGTTTTLSPGSNATVTQSGAYPNFTLNFGIPAGVQGGSLSYPGVLTDGNNGLAIQGATTGPVLQLTTTTVPICSTITAGQLRYTQGNATTRDVVQVCTHDAGNVYAWRTMIVPTLTSQGQAVVYSPTGAVAGNPTASAKLPDTDIQPIGPYATQSGAIGSVTDANAKTALNGIDAYLLRLQTALSNAAILSPNSFTTLLATTPGAVYWAFNPTGAASNTSNITNQLAATAVLNFLVQGASGAPNFSPGKSSMFDGGSLKSGACPSGPATKLIATDFDTAAHCGQTITSTAQITSGAGTLTNYIYPGYTASNTSLLTGYNVGGFTAILRGSPEPERYGSSGTATPLSATFIGWKPNEWRIGPDYCDVYNNGTTAYVNVSLANDVFGGNTNLILSQPGQTVLVYDGAGHFTCYANDGAGLKSGTASATLTATTASAFQISSGAINYWISSVVYLPGVQLTQTQVASLYYGWSQAKQPWNNWQAWPNQAPSYTTPAGTQWNTHTFAAGDGYLRDCVPLGTFNNGANGGTGNYLAQPAFCHAVLSTSAPYVNFDFAIGTVANGFSSISTDIHVDGKLGAICDPASGVGDFTCGVTSPSPGTHTYDATIGFIGGGYNTGYSQAQLTSAFGGAFLRFAGVPLPYSMSAVAETGTITLLDTDSILAGFTVPNSSARTFAAFERYANPGGNNSFGDPNFAVIGYGARLTSTDWNPTGLTNLAASFPDPTAIAFAAANITPALNGLTLAHVVMETGVNDFLHNCAGANHAFPTNANGLAIYAYALRNAMTEYHALNSSVVLYRLSMFNYQATNETITDGCTGNNYTFANTFSIPAYNAGVWNGTYSVTAGTTTITTAATLNQYRAVARDVCASYTWCVWTDTGPGGAASTNGYVVPTLSTANSVCYVGAAQSCFNTGDNLHLSVWGHCVVTKYLDDLLGGTLNTAGFHCVQQ